MSDILRQALAVGYQAAPHSRYGGLRGQAAGSQGFPDQGVLVGCCSPTPVRPEFRAFLWGCTQSPRAEGWCGCGERAVWLCELSFGCVVPVTAAPAQLSGAPLGYGAEQTPALCIEDNDSAHYVSDIGARRHTDYLSSFLRKILSPWSAAGRPRFAVLTSGCPSKRGVEPGFPLRCGCCKAHRLATVFAASLVNGEGTEFCFSLGPARTAGRQARVHVPAVLPQGTDTSPAVHEAAIRSLSCSGAAGVKRPA